MYSENIVIAQVAEDCISFILRTLTAQKKEKIVVAVSGGIDSATVVTLAARAMGPKNIFPVFLPFGEQSTEDAQAVVEACGIPNENWHTILIDPIVTGFIEARPSARGDKVRVGNAMARARMMVVFDVAKKLEALVCGTENRTEKYLGYFTRFGDGASDLEPIHHLYKTQIQKLAAYLEVPQSVLTKTPSAGLWQGQSDEQELGFSYLEADAVLLSIFGDLSGIEQGSDGEKKNRKNLRALVSDMEAELPWVYSTVRKYTKKMSDKTGVEPETVEKILSQITNNWFKQCTPYSM